MAELTLDNATEVYWRIQHQWNGKPLPGRKMSVEFALSFIRQVLNTHSLRKTVLGCRCLKLQEEIIHRAYSPTEPKRSNVK